VRAGTRAFASGVGWVVIETVDVVRLNELTDHDALADGFESRMAMTAALRRMYPRSHRRDGQAWYRVTFRLENDNLPATEFVRPAAPTTPPRGSSARLSSRGCANRG